MTLVSSATHLLRSTLRRTSSVVVAVSLCMLMACSGEDENTASDAGESGAQAADDGAPALPEVGQEPTVQGAQVFVKHWVAVLNHTSINDDTEPWRALAEPDCRACTGLADGIDALYDDGGSMTTDGWKVLQTSANLRPVGAAGAQVTGAEVRLRVNRLPEAVYEDADSQAEVFRGGKQTYIVMLVRVDDVWSVRSFAPVRRPAS